MDAKVRPKLSVRQQPIAKAPVPNHGFTLAVGNTYPNRLGKAITITKALREGDPLFRQGYRFQGHNHTVYTDKGVRDLTVGYSPFDLVAPTDP